MHFDLGKYKNYAVSFFLLLNILAGSFLLKYGLENFPVFKEKVQFKSISTSPNVQSTGNAFKVLQAQDEVTSYSAEINLDQYSKYIIQFTVDSIGGQKYNRINTDFCGPDYDLTECEFSTEIFGNAPMTVLGKIRSGKSPQKANFRIFYFGKTALKVSNISVEKLKGSYKVAKIILIAYLIVLFACLAFLFYKSNLQTILNIIVFLVIPFFLMYFLSFSDRPYCGDFFEYILMTESFFNHNSPELTIQDLNTFDLFYGHPLKEITDQARGFLLDQQYMSNFMGFFTSLNGVKYSYHSFMYSLLNLPARWIVELFGIGAAKTFPLTSALTLFLGALYIYFSRLTTYKKLICMLFLALMPSVFYLQIAHPEYVISVIVFISVLAFYEERYFVAIFLSSIAAAQIVPFIFLTAYFGIALLLNKGLTIKNILLGGCCMVLAFLQPCFYYLHFHKFNLIASSGFIQSDINWIGQFISFYFDINQGLIIGMPLILGLVILILGKKIWTKSVTLSDGLIVVSLIITLICITNSNRNAGSLILARYGVWIAPILIVYCLFEYEIILKRTREVVLIVLSQFFILTHFDGPFANFDYVEHKGYVQRVLTYAPFLYNPDPEVFAERTLHREGYTEKDSPIVFTGLNGKVTKKMIAKINPETKVVEWEYENY